MPFTPFHFGPCAAVALPLRKWIDLPSFILVNLFIDIEPYTVQIFKLDFPEHGLFHTWTVGILVAGVWSCIAYRFRGLFKKWMAAVKLNYETSFKKIFFSSVLGIWFHVALDATLYQEVKLFYPLNANPFYGAFTEKGLWWVCIFFFALAFVFYRMIIKKPLER